MATIFWKIISWFATFGCLVAGTFTGTNGNDYIVKYRKAVDSVEYYSNTLETAIPQTEIYDLISDHLQSAGTDGKTKKAIVIGYDGCRADALSLINDENPSAIKTLAGTGEVALSYCGGVAYPVVNKQKTSTAPGWCSMLTGVWADVNGVTDNDIPMSKDVHTLLVSDVENGTIDDSAFYVSWGGHFSGDDSTYVYEKAYAEEKGLNVDFLRASDDNGTYANVMADLSQEDCSDFIFSIFEFCDHIGHSITFNTANKEYQGAFYDAEAAATDIINKIQNRPSYDSEDWLILITSDHGGYNNWHGGPTIQERYTFIASNKSITGNDAASAAGIALYKKDVRSVPYYQNTLADAVPQTALYGYIDSHLRSASADGKTKKAIVIGYDGCRADALSLINDSKVSAIRTLGEEGGVVLSYCGGVPYPQVNTQATSTAPGWCSMLTGAWADVHGVYGNSMPKSNDVLSLLTTEVKDGVINGSAFYVSWDGHFSESDATYINEKQYIEENGLNVKMLCANGDTGTRKNVMSDLDKADCSDFIFSIFEYCDHDGHSTGFGPENSMYRKAFYSSEKTASDIIAKIKARPTYNNEDWLIIITSDHGGFETGHGGPTIQERYTFIASNKTLDF